MLMGKIRKHIFYELLSNCYICSVFGTKTMKISEALYSGSSVRISEKPKQAFPEFAFIGRSNVGKSSLINTLCNNNKLALTSSKPGKTRCINHFLINRKWYLVDLPGYGYAQASQTERKKISQVINNYISLSAELVNLFVLIDSRHDIGQTDMDFLIELGQRQIPFAIIFTKADKLGPMALQAQIEKNKRQILELWEELPPIFISSSVSKSGKDEILDYIDSILSQLESSTIQ